MLKIITYSRQDWNDVCRAALDFAQGVAITDRPLRQMELASLKRTLEQMRWQMASEDDMPFIECIPRAERTQG